jgi:hypothetical protein
MSAKDAAKISKPLFDIPPIGRCPPDSMVVKYGELADRVADFMGENSIRVGDWSGSQRVLGSIAYESVDGDLDF